MDWSESNFSIPKEINLHIISFMNDKTKRQMRVVNTTWFKMVNYSTFSLYNTTIDTLPAIIDRLSKYSHPIGINFKQPIVPRIQIIPYLTKLTNLTSLYLPATDANQGSPADWMCLTVLSNLQCWEGHLRVPHQLLAKLHNLTQLTVRTSEAFTDDLTKFTSLLSFRLMGNSINDGLDITSLPYQLTDLHIPASISGLNQGITRFTNLKNLFYYSYGYKPKDPLPFNQLSSLNNLSIVNHSNSIGFTQLPRNLTRLHISCMTPQAKELLCQLDKLKEISLGGDLLPDNFFEFLTVMTALEQFKFTPSSISATHAYTTGAFLTYLQSKLTALTLPVNPFTLNLDNLSKLDSLENLRLFEEIYDAETSVDYSSIRKLTKLTSLDITLNNARPSLLCVTDLTALQILRFAPNNNSVTFDERLILSGLTNLQQLLLCGCTKTTVDSISRLTNLCAIEGPIMFPDTDYSFLTSMRLTSLMITNALQDPASFCTVLSTLTELCQIGVRSISLIQDVAGSMTHITRLLNISSTPGNGL